MSSNDSSTSSTKVKISKDFKPIFEPFRDYALEQFGRVRDIGAYQGPWTAEVDPRQREALGSLTNLARSRAAGDFARPVIQLGERMLDPGYTDVGSDPIVLNAIRAATNPVAESEMDALGYSRGIAGGAGVDLGSRAMIDEDRIRTSANRVRGDVASQIALGELQNREQLQANAAPSIYAGGLGLEETAPRLLGEVGAAERQLIQETEVDPALAAYNELFDSSIRGMLPLQAILGSTGFPTSAGSRANPAGSSYGNLLSTILGSVLGSAV